MTARKKWEYETLYVGGNARQGSTHTETTFKKELNKLGNQGWEMVGQGFKDGSIFQYLVFKREK